MVAIITTHTATARFTPDTFTTSLLVIGSRPFWASRTLPSEARLFAGTGAQNEWRCNRARPALPHDASATSVPTSTVARRRTWSRNICVRSRLVRGLVVWWQTQRVLDGSCGEVSLRHELDRRCRRQRLAQVALRIARDQDHARQVFSIKPSDSTGQLQAVLLAEVDVDQHHIRLQLRCAFDRLRAVGGHPDNADPLLLEETASRLEELWIVVDHQAAESRHPPSMAAGAARRIEATRKPPH